MSVCIAAHLEELFNILFSNNHERGIEFIFVGSFGEGLYFSLSRAEENFDFDLMICTKNAKVVIERKNVIKQQYYKIFILESSPHPGYAGLRYYKEPMGGYCYLDTKNARINEKATITTKITDSLTGCKYTSFEGINGPAMTFHMGNYKCAPYLDIVESIHCDEWPCVANEWIKRTRSNWPSKAMISKILKLGCDLVPVGSHGNNTDSKEWRISFVRAERYLIRTLNDAQLKTLVLLKVIFRHRMLGDGFHDTVSGYVAKCSFFWISEDYGGRDWKTSGCIQYLWLCLRKIKIFLEEENCPHYFMRECNVLHGKLNGGDKKYFCKKLELVLEKSTFKEKIFELPVFGNINNIVSFATLFTGYTISTHRCCVEFFAGCMFQSLSENSKDSKNEVIKHIRDMLDNIQRTLKSNPSTIELQYLCNFLLCNQLRFENIAIDRFQKTEDDLVKRIDTFLSGACLQK